MSSSRFQTANEATKDQPPAKSTHLAYEFGENPGQMSRAITVPLARESRDPQQRTDMYLFQQNNYERPAISQPKPPTTDIKIGDKNKHCGRIEDSYRANFNFNGDMPADDMLKIINALATPPPILNIQTGTENEESGVAKGYGDKTFTMGGAKSQGG